MEAVETIESGELRASLYQDEDATPPSDWDQLGTLVTWHRRYCFQEDGTKRFGTPQDFLREARREHWIYLPAAMLDHSGITLYEGKGAHCCDPGGWDSGQVGFYYATRESIANIGTPIRSVRRVLRAELEEWDKCVRGDVYGYVIETRGGKLLDSLWGLYGGDYALREMHEALERAVEAAKAGEELERTGFAL